MKRLLISAALYLLAATAVAGDVRERDVLLTDDGVLYSVDAIRDGEASAGGAVSHLAMTVQTGDERVTHTVPGSTNGASHGHPALAYDADSKTLFLFWQETLHRGLSSRLLFTSFRDEQWSEVTALDSVTWKFRRNLRIAVTRSIETVNEEGAAVQVPQVMVHAVWWEETGQGEFARYAMLGIDHGRVTSSDLRFLVEFTGATVDGGPLVAKTSREVLRHPAVIAAPGRGAVDVVFGDAATGEMHRLRIKPVLDGRLRIPIGIRGPVMRNPALEVAIDARVETVVDENTVALYAITEKTLDYVVFRNDAWSVRRSVALSSEVTAQVAVEALRRMVATY